MDKQNELLVGLPELEAFNEQFPIVEVSKLSMHDIFMRHRPGTYRQMVLKESIERIIKSDMPDFRRPAMDPSVDEKGNIFFKAGSKPAVGHSGTWWYIGAKLFMPSKNSHLGKPKQYDAFLGTIIKYLVEEEGCKVREAWEMVCDDSSNFARYWNPENPALYTLELTGSKKVHKWYDLGNTFKCLKQNDAFGFTLAGGCRYGEASYLADFRNISLPGDDCSSCSVGWIVLDV